MRTLSWQTLLGRNRVRGTRYRDGRRQAGLPVSSRALRLTAEVLEPRCLLTDAAGVEFTRSGSTVVVPASQWSDNGLSLVVSHDAFEIGPTGESAMTVIPFESVSRLVLQGRNQAADELTVTYLGQFTDAMPTIDFHGGTGGDQDTLIVDGWLPGSLWIEPELSGSGTLSVSENRESFDAGEWTRTLNYRGVERVVAVLSVNEQFIQLGSENNDVILDWVDAEQGIYRVTDRTTGLNLETTNWGNWNLIRGGAGHDRIENRVEVGTFLFGQAGNDTLLGAMEADGGDGADLLKGFMTDWTNSLFGGAGNDTLVAGSGSENPAWLEGGPGNDVLQGSDGDDSLFGDAGNDTLDGGVGHDSLFGDSIFTADSEDFRRIGNDLLLGGDGEDQLVGDAGNDTLDGGGDRDSLYGGSGPFADGENFIRDGNDLLRGGADDDCLLGEAGHDTLLGEHGWDTLLGNEGNDRLEGGDGNDELYGNEGNDSLFGQGGDDFLWEVFGSNLLDGGDDDDEIEVWPGEELLGGSNTLLGQAGNDILRGGLKNDSLSGGKGADYIFGDYGNDTLRGDAGPDTLWGWEGNDFLDGGSQRDSLDGDEGDDTLLGRDGNDYLEGGEGDDLLEGGVGHDRVEGGDGRDRLFGGEGNDYLFGDEGDPDFLDGGLGRDKLEGDSEDRLLNGELSADDNWDDEFTDIDWNVDSWSKTFITAADWTDGGLTIAAEPGRLIISRTDSGEILKIIDDSFRGTFDRLRIEGRDAGADVLTVNVTPWLDDDRSPSDWEQRLREWGITFAGLGGDDELRLINDLPAQKIVYRLQASQWGTVSRQEHDGFEQFLSYRGVEVVRDLATADQKFLIFGDEDNDIVYEATPDPALVQITDAATSSRILQRPAKWGMLVRAGAGNDQVSLRGTWQLVPEVEGDAGNDLLTGSDGNDFLHGNVGNDTLIGLGGDDWLDGGEGNDLLLGGVGDDGLVDDEGGNDSLHGEAGEDVLWGWIGNDLLDGGPDSDETYGDEGHDLFLYRDDELSGDDENDFDPEFDERRVVTIPLLSLNRVKAARRNTPDTPVVPSGTESVIPVSLPWETFAENATSQTPLISTSSQIVAEIELMEVAKQPGGGESAVSSVHAETPDESDDSDVVSEWVSLAEFNEIDQLLAAAELFDGLD